MATNFKPSNNLNLLSPSFWESGVWAQLIGVLHKAVING